MKNSIYCLVVIVLVFFNSASVKCFKLALKNSNHKSQLKSESPLHMSSFNPFTNRNKNTNVKWYENDMGNFYNFVENQPLLTSKQELQYGKAIKMWIKVEKMRENMERQYNNVTNDNSDSMDNLQEYDQFNDEYNDDYDNIYGNSNRNTILNTTQISMRVISNAELAEKIGCSVATIEKMKRYAELSKRRLVNSNLKLVMAVVSRYRQSNIPNSELIAEGTRGLAKAALRYDFSKGFRFATYATWYIHQSISDYVRFRKHPARMPSRYIMLNRKIKSFTSSYLESHSRYPTIPEMSKSLGASEFDIIKSLSMQAYPILLNTPMNFKESYKQTGQEKTYEDVLPSIFKSPTDLSNTKDLRRDMESMIQSNLNDVERDVLRLRLGLDDGRVKPVKEIGRIFHISWKQVRSLEKQALSKLLDSNEIGEFCDKMMDV